MYTVGSNAIGQKVTLESHSNTTTDTSTGRVSSYIRLEALSITASVPGRSSISSIIMSQSTRLDPKLSLGQLPSPQLVQTRSAASTGANSPNDGTPGATTRYPLGNGLAAVGMAGLSNRTGAGSPSKEYGGSRLFPKRYVHTCTTLRYSH